MNHRELTKIALDRDIGELKEVQGLTIDIGGTVNKNTKSDFVFSLPEWYFPRDNIPVQSGTVSLIHCYHFLEHLSGEDAIKFLLEVQRVLKDGGIFQFGMPYYNTELAHHDLTHKSFWTESSFENLMRCKYYNVTEHNWNLYIQSQCIIGVVERNLMLVGQLIKKEEN